MINRELPRSEEAEVNILAAIMNDEKKLLQVINEINVDDFYYTKHKNIYKAVMQLFSENKPVEPVTLINAIGKENLKEVGGVTYITELISAYVSAYSIKHNINILKEKSRRRRLIKAINEAQEKAFNPEEDINSILSVIEECKIQNEKRKMLTDNELFAKTIEEIEKRYNNGGEIAGMKTGYHKLDKVMNGFHKGDLNIIAARPAMGRHICPLC